MAAPLEESRQPVHRLTAVVKDNGGGDSTCKSCSWCACQQHWILTVQTWTTLRDMDHTKLASTGLTDFITCDARAMLKTICRQKAPSL